jgi:hypothetical protein
MGMPNGFDRVIVRDFGQAKVMCGSFAGELCGLWSRGDFGLKGAKREEMLPVRFLSKKIAQLNWVSGKLFPPIATSCNFVNTKKLLVSNSV